MSRQYDVFSVVVPEGTSQFQPGISILGRGVLIALIYMLGTMMVHIPAWAQEPEVVLYQEDFDGQAQGWELEPGWRVIQDGDNWVLAGEGHQWARPGGNYGSDFRVQFRLKLLQGRIHLVYRLNETGRYFIGFHEGGSDLNKQYWPDTFMDGLASSTTPHTLGDWHQIEIVGQGARLRFLVDGQMEWEYTPILIPCWEALLLSRPWTIPWLT